MASRDCGICLEQYDEDNRRPRCLSCGHTFCSSCLAAALTRDRDQLLCPFCRLPHACSVTRLEDVPVNFTVVSLLQDVARCSSTPRAQALLAEVKLEANEFTTSQLVACSCHLTRLKDFQQRVAGTQELQKEQVEALGTLLARHQAILKDLAATTARVTTVLAQGQDQRLALEKAQAKVNTASSLLEVTASHEEDRTRSTNLEEWITEAQQLLQSQVVGTARELECVTGAGLHAVVEHNMAEVTEALAQTKPGVPASPPGHAQAECEGGGRGGVVRVLREIGRLAEMVGSSVWGSRVWEGRPRCARLTLTPHRLYLSALREGDPPRYSHILPYEKIRGLVDESYLKVFLEVSWAGQVQGRVCIRLVNTVARTRQFFLLCSGERGPSYLHTRLLEVESRGRPGERVWGGDYQHNDGSGGAALPGLTRGPLHSQSVIAGLVAGFCYDDDHRKPAHFVIYTVDCPVVYEECPLGRVEEGLEVLRAAASLPDITTVTVTDCGLVVSL